MDLLKLIEILIIKVIDENVFMAINSQGIQRIDVKSDSIYFWTYSEILSLYPEIEQKILYKGYPFFSNICATDSVIFIGCRILQDYWMGYTRNDGSLLFKYSINRSTWDVIYLENFEGLGILSFNDNKIWFGGNQLEESEGDFPFLHGGVGFYDLNTKDIQYIKSIPKKMLVLDFEHKNDATLVRIFANKKIYTYTIGRTLSISLTDSSIYSSYKDLDLYSKKILKSITKADSIRFSEKLFHYKVSPRLIMSDSLSLKSVEKYK